MPPPPRTHFPFHPFPSPTPDHRTHTHAHTLVCVLPTVPQVYSWWDHGLLSAALHPDFPEQPYLYIAVRLRFYAFI